ncbi:MAG: Xylulokinase [Bacteroidota bacterium]|jgi:xylulokinase
MILCGIDIGTSSIKVSIVDAANQHLIYSTSYPEVENEISSPQPGFAEQDPEHWWYCVKQAILKANSTGLYDPKNIGAIGISYQMHGLVVVDKESRVLRPSIIWCDSRATPYGEKAYAGLGEVFCQSHYLNSPGNFTASKLAWVKENQPEVFEQIHQVLLPGDFIAGRFTSQFTTTASALSEGILWDFKEAHPAKDLMAYFGFPESIFPPVQALFSDHGTISTTIAAELGINPQVKVTYKAGDQPNNAYSLGVLHPGDIATTAGTSGVVYGISAELKYDKENRVNSFAHVNHSSTKTSVGVLMCINGTGILNRWIKQNFFSSLSYSEMNVLGSKASIGSNGLVCMPFGNGAERIFQNKTLGGSFMHLDFNRHQSAEIIRAAQEGIAFSMVYGIELLGNVGVIPKKLKAGQANMYLSDLFTQAIVNASGASVELLDSDGAFGAALGSGAGIGYYSNEDEAVSGIKILKTIEPDVKSKSAYDEAYGVWKSNLAH